MREFLPNAQETKNKKPTTTKKEAWRGGGKEEFA